jgi:hypothetical protein
MGLDPFRLQEKGESSCRIISQILEEPKETIRMALLI